MPAQQAIECDVLVIGSGAGGMAAAVTAAKLGLDVLLIEKEPHLGGTTAMSGGWLWVPCSHLALQAGIDDTPGRAREYLRSELGDRYDASRVDAYLDAAPRMIAFFERETAVRFFLGRDYPDYHPDRPGALPGGRAVCAEPFDGRELGEALAHIKPPPRELTLFGIKVGSGPDFRHFANAQRSLSSAWYVVRRVLTHMTQRVAYGRDPSLVSGGALIGRMVKTALELNVRLWRSTAACALVLDGGRITGAVAERSGVNIRIAARRGVVSAAGGFPRDMLRRGRLFRQAGENGECYSLASAGNTGDGLAMAERVGAAMEETCVHAAAWMPVSRVPYRDGRYGVYPHTFDRGKPGVIAVNVAGRRFVNEGDSYHDVGAAMLRGQPAGAACSAFLVCDRTAIRRYGLGLAKPWPVPLGPYVRSGYLKRGNTVAELADRAGINGEELRRTLETFNAAAREGRDPEFGRGGNVYNQYQGDPAARPSRCLAPIVTPPFYAVKIYPGDLGTFDGLKTDCHARVLDSAGTAIPGLYAAGTDMASVFGGCYPGPGINLGPAMTFGYIAAQHMTQRK